VRLLLDTHILLALARNELEQIYPRQAALMQGKAVERFGSSASLWEMTIKIGIGKLELGMPPSEFVAYLEELGVQWLNVTPVHATRFIDPEPRTRDPFDRMLLAQCAVENVKLVTVDRLMAGHILVAAF
jgi:PIN domain nuclease of toxin-antitoxin system